MEILDYSQHTEQDWFNSLDEELKKISDNFSIFTIKRTFNNASYYIAKFAIRTTSNNIDAVNTLIRFSFETDGAGRFQGSEIDVSGGNLEIDFLFFEAKIIIRTI